MPQHRGFGLNTTNSPAENSESIDHGGVRVGANQGVWISRAAAILLAYENHASKVFEIDLVHDAGIGRNDCKVMKRSLSPAQECVTFFITYEFKLSVQLK